MRPFFYGSVVLALAACSSASSRSVDRTPAPAAALRQADAGRRITAIADSYYQSFLNARPLRAFAAGAPDAALDRVDDNSLAGLARWQQQENTWLAELRTISPSNLAAGSEAVTYHVVRHVLESSIARRICRDELWPARQQGGPQQLPTLVAMLQPVGTTELRRQAIARFRALGPYIDTSIGNLRHGVRQGYTSPRLNVDAVIEQLDGLLAVPADSSPMLMMAQRDSAPQFRQALVTVLQEDLYPALERYRHYLRSEYQPVARESPSISAIPGGDACYRARLRDFTTLDLSAAAIHKLGLEEMERTEAETRLIARRRFDTIDLPALFERLRADTQFKFAGRQEVVDSAEAALRRVRPRLKRMFGRLPRAEMVVDPCLPFEEKSGCPNSYVAAAQDGSRPGRWRVNTSPDRASRVDLEAIAFHEGYPGHHFQFTLAQERGQAHPLTRITYLSGFGEGWGLYSEQLANEMGAYSGDVAQLGRLSLSAWRAARLVVDTGLHAFGWSRDRAIAYMLAHTALPRQAAISEVDRYIINPGQATAYLVGRIEIQRLRSEAERRLGSRFDLRSFHDRLLANGSIPLSFLRQQIERWIASELSRAGR
jgi:uncharacterized protein (DUF885 family)